MIPQRHVSLPPSSQYEILKDNQLAMSPSYSSSSSSSPSSAPRWGKDKEAQQLQAKAQETLQIMDDTYLPRPPVIYRSLRQDRSAYVDAAGHLHDINYRPFPPIKIQPYSASHHPPRRSRTAPTAYWETFEIGRGPYDAGHLHCGSAGCSITKASFGTPLVQYNYPPFRTYTADPSSLAVHVSQKEPVAEIDEMARSWEEGGSIDEEQGLETGERAGRERMEVKSSLALKEKLRGRWAVAKFCFRLRVVRTLRWFRECTQPQVSDSRS